MWYSDGTINVTNGSTAVVGVSTAWAGTVRQGWAWPAPDGKLYQVLSVNSNTSITLARPYGGTTATGLTYDLVPTQGETRALTARLSDLIATYAGYLTTKLQGLFSAGSASTPGVAREGDANTGLFWPADDEVGVSTGGAERIRVKTNGNTGVGTSNPAQRLVVSEAGAQGLEIGPSAIDGGVALVAYNRVALAYLPMTAVASYFAWNLSGGAETMRLASAGLGIGTLTPQRLLHLEGSELAVGAYQAVLEGANNGYGAGISFQSRTSSGGARAEMARITADGEASWTADSASQFAGLRFSTTINGVLSERMRIDASGNVGIGAASPTSRLDINGNTIRLRSPATPASASTAGPAGTIAWDTNFVYVCVATNTWKRAALSTW